MIRYFLGIETSCDETGIGIFDAEQKLMLSNALFSQVKLHEEFGGVMPEISSRSHLEKIGIVLQQALDEANITLSDIGGIGVTNRPGLFGSLLVGICFAKGLSYSNNIPIMGINHNQGHIVAALLNQENQLRNDQNYPFLCLSVSGGHTSIFLVNSPTNFELLGETLDDAAGEAFDKVAKLLNLGYPGGPIIEKLAKTVENKDFFKYPRNKDRSSLNFSFSGIKTAVLYDLVKKGIYSKDFILQTQNLTPQIQGEVASSFQWAVTEILLNKINIAIKKFPNIKSIVLVGGVACNKFITEKLNLFCLQSGITFQSPPIKFCTDNGAMIALSTYFEYLSGKNFQSLEELDLIKI